LLASLLLHGAVIGLMLWAGLASKQPVSEVPLALELWSSPPPAPLPWPNQCRSASRFALHLRQLLRHRRRNRLPR
jgi:hypothetical protein